MIRFRARRGVVYTSLTERASKETIGVYMKNNDYRHFYWGGVMDRHVARLVQAKVVKIIMSEYTTDPDPMRAVWHKITEDSVLLGCALPGSYLGWVVFALIEDDTPVILKMPKEKKVGRGY